MSKKEIERLDKRLESLKNQINNRITIAFVVFVIIAFAVFCIWLSLNNTEWQCTEWQETDELVDCEEILIWDCYLYCNLPYCRDGNFEMPCISMEYKTEIKCEHKKVCTQEYLTREVIN